MNFLEIFLNAEEEPEDPIYPYKDSAFVKSYMVRGVLKCRATDKDDPTVDPRFGRVGKQIIEDSGPLTKNRMETIDDETFGAAIDFIKGKMLTENHSSAGVTQSVCMPLPMFENHFVEKAVCLIMNMPMVCSSMMVM